MPHPAAAQLLRFFKYDHLPAHLAEVSKPFCVLARSLAGVPEHDQPELTQASDLSTMFAGLIGQLDGPELTVALRKLLEAKDCAVRAALAQGEE